ncbi:DeoR/GlpR family DNA-binding transcription regulator [Jatrophihabitans endophyticus]|uniref:DeoR/GlpR family DNA-binding transcription regulator n=1 Tax=Jatrophihabitans endophyticus TaxID=1206085 RepID=UPI0009353A89
MQRYERLNAVLEALAESGKLSVEQIVERFDVSPATVRRDLDDLAAQQLVTRTRGGAVVQSVSYDLPLRYKSVRQSDEKQRIADTAADLVRPGAVVGLNGGTTTSAVARTLATRTHLAGTANGSGPTQLTVVTNALNIANELVVRPHVKVVVIGGVARPQSYELIGPLSRRLLDDIAVDVLILGVNAISAGGGAAAHNEGEAEINRLMVERSNRVVVVADGSKVGLRAFARICDTGRVDALVTDGTADADELQRLREAGVDVTSV